MGESDIIECVCGHFLSAHDEGGGCVFCDCQEFEEEE